MSQELLKKLLVDSEAYSARFKKDLLQTVEVPKGKGAAKQSKKIQKLTKPKKAQAGNKMIGDKFKSIIKKMKVSTDKNLILEKNLKHLQKLKSKSKVADTVSTYLLDKLAQK